MEIFTAALAKLSPAKNNEANIEKNCLSIDIMVILLKD
jgi:hypothetical protein